MAFHLNIDVTYRVAAEAHERKRQQAQRIREYGAKVAGFLLGVPSTETAKPGLVAHQRSPSSSIR
jgi:hypothetical protein